MIFESDSALRNLERLLRKTIDLKTLLSGKSVLECTITASKLFMENNEGSFTTGNVSKEYMDLYILVKNKVTELYDNINQMKYEYQKHPHLTMICALPKYKSLVNGFHSALEEIGHFLKVQDLINHGINSKPPTTHAKQLKRSVRSVNRGEPHARIPAQPRPPSRVDKRIKYAQKPQNTRSRRNQRPHSLDLVRQNMDTCIYNRQKRGSCRNCGLYNHWESECSHCCGRCSRDNHTVSFCWKTPSCYTCGKPGHMSGDCF